MRKTKLYRAVLFCLLGSPALYDLTAQEIRPPASGQKAIEGPSPLITASTGPSEDWSALRVNPASLEPMAYAVIGTAEHQEFTSELLRIQWRSADPIDLYVIKPHGVKNPPVVLYLYGYPSDSDRFRDDSWC